MENILDIIRENSRVSFEIYYNESDERYHVLLKDGCANYALEITRYEALDSEFCYALIRYALRRLQKLT